ncbi:unnamed protein product, partial [Brassica oleracea]
VKSHDTKDCKVLYGHFLKSIESGKQLVYEETVQVNEDVLPSKVFHKTR